MIDFIQELTNQANDYGVIDYVYPVLGNPNFKIWSGAGKGIHHHYGDGGLVKHTYEVWMLARSVASTYKSYSGNN